MAKSKNEFSQAALDDAYNEGAWVGTAQTLISMSVIPLMVGFGVVAAVVATPAVVIASRFAGPPLGRALRRAFGNRPA